MVHVFLRRRNPSRQALHQAWKAPQRHHPPVGLSDQELSHLLVPGVRAERELASRVALRFCHLYWVCASWLGLCTATNRVLANDSPRGLIGSPAKPPSSPRQTARSRQLPPFVGQQRARVPVRCWAGCVRPAFRRRRQVPAQLLQCRSKRCQH